MDNLESCTYEVFEKDPIKYEEYGKVCKTIRFYYFNIFSIYFILFQAINEALNDLKTSEEMFV